jgi:ATP-binding cassette subfamily A (ABC1) protein 5
MKTLKRLKFKGERELLTKNFFTSRLELIREKQSKMKEYMKMAGLKESIYWLSWFITYAFPVVLISLAMTLTIYFVIKEHLTSNTTPVFFHILLFGLSVTTFALLVTSFVKSTKIATLITVLWIILPSQFTFLFREASLTIQIFASLISPLAFQMGFYKWAYFEMIQFPQQYFDWSDFSLGWGMLMLSFDTLLYLFLAW